MAIIFNLSIYSTMLFAIIIIVIILVVFIQKQLWSLFAPVQPGCTFLISMVNLCEWNITAVSNFGQDMAHEFKLWKLDDDGIWQYVNASKLTGDSWMFASLCEGTYKVTCQGYEGGGESGWTNLYESEIIVLKCNYCDCTDSNTGCGPNYTCQTDYCKHVIMGNDVLTKKCMPLWHYFQTQVFL